MFFSKALLLITVVLPLAISAPADLALARKKRSASLYAVEGCFASFVAEQNKQMGDDNSNVKCQDRCKDYGYILAATKAEQCQCGNIYPKGHKVSDSQCTTKCRSWAFCHDPQSCCGGPGAYTVSVVGNIDVAKQVLRRLSYEWQTKKEFRDQMKGKVVEQTPETNDQDWWQSFDHEGWSFCGHSRYIRGLYRSAQINRNRDGIDRLEAAKCSDASGYLYSSEGDRDCYNHNWWDSFDRRGWSTCNEGYYIAGFHRNSGHEVGLHRLETAHCCRPRTQEEHWGDCYNHNIWSSFDREGWAICNDGYYLAGLYRSDCDHLYCLEELKCCKMGPRKSDAWIERPDIYVKIKDANGELKHCSMNAMDYSPESKSYKCTETKDTKDMLAISALKFTIKDTTELNVAKPQPIQGFSPVICSPHSGAYTCTKSLAVQVSTSSSLTTSSGFSSSVSFGTSVEVSGEFLGIGAKTSFTTQVSETKSFDVTKSNTKTYSTTDKTDVSIQVPKDTEIMINYMRTKQDLEYKWEAIFKLLGKYSVKFSNGQEMFDDVTTVLSGKKNVIYAFGKWRYPSTDVLRVVITDKYGNQKGSGCEHEPGKAQGCTIKA